MAASYLTDYGQFIAGLHRDKQQFTLTAGYVPTYCVRKLDDLVVLLTVYKDGWSHYIWMCGCYLR